MRLNISAITCINKAGEGYANKMIERKVNYIIKRVVLFGCLICALSLCACGAKIADEEQIKHDLEKDKKYYVLSEDETIDEVIIDDRDTDKKYGEDEVECTITSHDKERSYSKEVVIEYELDKEDGWVLDDITVSPRNEWEIFPVVGVNTDTVLNCTVGQSITDGGDEWYISNESISDMSIINQDTNLEKKEDIVTAHIVLKDEVEQLSGDISYRFHFDDGWKCDSVINTQNIEINTIPGTEVNTDEEAIISIIGEQGLTVVEGDSKQTISLDSSEVSQFSIESTQEAEKGKLKTYDCSFDLSKGLANLKVKAVVEYYFTKDAGWTGRMTENTVAVDSLSLSGIWEGEGGKFQRTHPDTVTLTIEQDTDNKITGKYRFVDGPNGYVGESFVNGYFNPETLGIVLEMGDWIEKPKYASLYDGNIRLVFYVNTQKIKGRGPDNWSVSLMQTE